MAFQFSTDREPGEVRTLPRRAMSGIATAKFIEYSDSEHRYFVNGREFRSVTQILNAAGLVSPYCKDEEARWRGTTVHEICAADDISRVDLRTVDNRLRGYVVAWRAYRDATGFSATLTEHRVDCEEYCYAGRFDRLGTFPGQKLETLIDIKTSKTGVVPRYARLQLVAYGHALDPTKVYGRVAVALRPDGRFNTMPYSIATYAKDKAEWLQLVQQTKEEGRNEHN